jgi:hypothetical protein
VIGLVLTETEADTLAHHEATIRAGLDTFVEVGQALAAIRDQRLYRTTHDTFEDYCRERWQLASRTARQMIDAAAVVDALDEDRSGAVAPLPVNEAQARPLTKLRDDPAAVRAAWSRATDHAETEQKPITAAIVEQAVRDELAERRAAQQQVTEDRAQIAEFNAATAHLVPQADLERPWSLAAIAVSRAIEHLPLDTDPEQLAANVPPHSAYRLDALDDRAMQWITSLYYARAGIDATGSDT